MSFTGKIGTDWTGQYSRWIYDETKNYLMVAKMRLEPTTLGSIPLLDVELNAQAEILLQLLRRSIARIYGDGASNNGFKIVQSGISTTNNFTIMGGDGTTDGAGAIFVDGWMPVNLSDIEYTAQDGAAALTTPEADRTDEVYIDVYYKEVTAAVDSDLIDPASTLETSRRIALVWEVKVAEGGATPANYTDANNVFHWTMNLATLSRLDGDATITTAMIVDERNLNRVVSLASELAAHSAETDAHSSTATPTGDRIPLYDAGGRLKSNVPVYSNDCARKTETDAITAALSSHTESTDPHSATATPTASRIAMYDANARLKSGAAPAAENDCVRKAEADITDAALAAHIAAVSAHGAVSTPTASRIAKRDDSGDLHARLLRLTYDVPTSGAYFVGMEALGETDNFVKPMSPAQAVATLGYSASYGSPGYQQLPGGLILQWGFITSPSITWVEIVFPIAFTTAGYSFTVVDVGSESAAAGRVLVQRDSLTTTGANIIVSGQYSRWYWMAIGK